MGYKKVVTGYVLVIAVLGLAVWMVYSNTVSLMRMERTGRELVKRRGVTDSLVYCFLEMSNSERAVCLGRADEWEEFDRSLRRVMSLADSLKTLTGDSGHGGKADSLKALLALKRRNTMMIMEEIAGNSSDVFFREKVRSLHKGEDSVVIHTNTPKVEENKEVVYDIVKTRKGFFARLADAFRRQHTDTVRVRRRSSKAVSDSARHSIDIADTVAGVLEEIKREETEARRARMKGLAAREQAQQMVGVQIARRTGQLLEDIRKDEHRSLQAALGDDLRQRRGVMLKIILLAVVAVLSAMVLLFHVLRDIRRTRAYHENLEQAKAETERVMAQRERLLLTMTHDIKAPAASISGFIELLGEYVKDRKAASYLRNIRSSATHLLRLVGALLDYHRLESGEAETRSLSFSARQLIESCVEAMRPQADAKGLALCCDTAGCPGMLCRGDAFRIKQILDNLIGNALKYTSEGSVSVKAAVRYGWLHTDVSDTGCGMTPGEARRVFNAFTRLPGAQGTEGVGLGLSITKEIVTLLGGRITLESEKGKGTTFHVSLPVSVNTSDPSQGEGGREGEGESHAVSSVPHAAPSPAGSHCGSLPESRTGDSPSESSFIPESRGGFLIVDDDRLQLQLLKEMLARLSQGQCAVTACSSAAEAIATFGRERPQVFFVDIEMPEMSGTEIVSRLPSGSGTRLIAMTAHEPSIEPKLKEAGFDACLFKPFSIQQLAETLSAVTGERVTPSAEAAENKPESRFDTIMEYAAGDEAAAREILESLGEELKAHAATLRRAAADADRGAVSRVAHKALPVLEMLKAASTAGLKVLSPENIGNVDDNEIRRHCEVIINEMEEIIAEIPTSPESPERRECL